jgi:8-amino-7-oxononanoate synthase
MEAKVSLLDKCAEVTRRLEYVKAHNQYFYFREFEPTATPFVNHGGKRLMMLGANNYLGFANHPKVVAAARAALDKYGTGACSSRILTGTSPLHVEVERRLARFKGAEDTLLFSAGFLAMMGTVSAMTGPGDVVLSDAMNHASIIDGCRLSRADVRVYRHNDMTSLEEELQKSRNAANRLIVTDGVFSMKGTVANLPEIRRLADTYDAAVMVDDAHGAGALGARGRGTAEHFGLEGRIEFVCGTFSKTFASYGGFCCACRDAVTYMRFTSRASVFTASPPPVVAATVVACLDVMEQEPQLLEQVRRNAKFMKDGLRQAGFRLEDTITPIIPVLVGDDERTFKLAGGLEDEGIVVNPVVPPAVPNEGSLIRVSLMATFTLDQLAQALSKFKTVGRAVGVI